MAKRKTVSDRAVSEKAAQLGAAMLPMLRKRAKRIISKAREIITPTQCKECGKPFDWRDIAYGAWSHAMCKPHRAKWERRHVAGLDHYKNLDPFHLNRHGRRRLAMPKSRHARFEQPSITPRMRAA